MEKAVDGPAKAVKHCGPDAAHHRVDPRAGILDEDYVVLLAAQLLGDVPGSATTQPKR